MKVMTRFSIFLLAATAVFAQYKAQPAGDPPAEVAAPILGTLNKAGSKIVADKGAYVEIWLRSTMPTGPNTGESSVTLTTIPPGALLGVLRFPAKGSDRRGPTIAGGETRCATEIIRSTGIIRAFRHSVIFWSWCRWSWINPRTLFPILTC